MKFNWFYKSIGRDINFIILSLLSRTWGFPEGSVVKKKKKNPPANAKGARDTGSVPGSGGYPGGGNSNPL